MRRSLLVLFALIAVAVLIYVVQSRPPDNVIRIRNGGTTVMYFPWMVSPLPEPVKGIAGCGGGFSGGWCYQYFPHDTVDDSHAWQVVPLIRGADTGPFVVGASGYLLVLNEPDNCDPNAGDCLTPVPGAAFLRSVAAQLPNARLICCGTLFGTAWMDGLVAACPECIGLLTGVSFHDYALIGAACGTDEACITAHWVSVAQAWKGWIALHNGPYPSPKPMQTWLSEFGWSPSSEPDEATSIRHMAMLCGSLAGLGLTRYAWYVGPEQGGNISLFDATAQVTPLGAAYREEC